MSIKQRVALITGANSGIGLEAAKYFNEKGWKTIAVSRSERSPELPEEISFYQVDVGDPSQVEGLFSEITEKFGRLDTLVNNAAVQVAKPLLETTLEEWDRLMDVNLRAVFVGVKAAYPPQMVNSAPLRHRHR